MPPSRWLWLPGMLAIACGNTPVDGGPPDAAADATAESSADSAADAMVDASCADALANDDCASPAQAGESCNARACAAGLFCGCGTGPSQFVCVCQPQRQVGETCVLRTPGGNYDMGWCAPGLVCDLQADKCKIP